MENLIKDLYNFTARELNGVAWRAKLPLNHAVALDSFFQAFEDFKDIRTKRFDGLISANFYLTLVIRGGIKNFETSVSYDEILDGWKTSFRASPGSLYDSICQVYDKMGDKIEDFDKDFFYSEDLGWWYARDSHTKKIRQNMENYLLEFFSRYHEGALLPYKRGKFDNLESPRVFYKVLNDFPMDLLQQVVISKEIENFETPSGPCSETILDYSFDDFDIGSFFPSEASLMDLFWGMYLKELAICKGFPVRDNDFSLRNFITWQNYSLKQLSFEKDRP